MMSIVTFENLEFAYYHREPVLSGVDLDVDAGSVVGLLGRNGAGKTTLLRMLLGLMRPARGSVRVFGVDPVAHGPEAKRRIGYVSEEQILPDYLSVRNVIGLHRDLFPSWDCDFERELGGRFDFDSKKRIASLSKGQARQVALLCAVAHRPELLILDEPGGGLDPAMRREFLETAIELLASAGSTILFSSHHLADVERLAERIVILEEGRILVEGATDDLRESHCLLTVEGGNGLGDRLRQLPGCLRLRESSGELRGVFSVAPNELRGRLAPDLPQVTCSALSLEELFVELVGRSS